ncbi:MAG: LysR family transcriptional regulator [Acidovorax sp.]|jgi:DNA-binding transcriptional LysR family regulator|nr:LysR family transcriptional regulator [Acidovorax sp.]
MEWTLERLNQFVAVADCGSMTLAARRLGRAQSAISMAMGLLEADLGLELFDRSGRAVRLTPAGQVMLLEARALLDQAQALNLRAQSLVNGPSAKLTMALDEAMPYQPIRQLLGELAQRFPALELTVLNGTAAQVARDVQAQRAQLAFHFDWGPVGSDFSQRYVAGVPQMLCVARGHALARQQVVSRQELAALRQLVMHIEGVPDRVHSPRVWRCDSFYITVDMVADGLGWSILPRNIIEYGGARGRIAVLHCADLKPPPLAVRMLSLQGAVLDDCVLWIQQRMAELLMPEGGGGAVT